MFIAYLENGIDENNYQLAYYKNRYNQFLKVRETVKKRIMPMVGQK
jgi:hypothetical protein